MKEWFDKLSPRERILAILTAVSVVGFGIWLFVLAPRFKEMKMLNQEMESLRTEIAELKGRPGVVSAPGTANGTTARPVSLPNGFEMLERLAGKHRVDLIGIKLSAPEDLAGYAAYPAGIDLAGRYRNIVEFLEGVERMPGWIQVRGIRVEGEPGAAPRLEAHLEAVILDEKKVGTP